MVDAFDPRIWQKDVGSFLSLKPAKFTEPIPGQPWIHRETLSLTTPLKTKKAEKMKESKLRSYGSKAIRNILLWSLHQFLPQNSCLLVSAVLSIDGELYPTWLPLMENCNLQVKQSISSLQLSLFNIFITAIICNQNMLSSFLNKSVNCKALNNHSMLPNASFGRMQVSIASLVLKASVILLSVQGNNWCQFLFLIDLTLCNED